MNANIGKSTNTAADHRNEEMEWKGMPLLKLCAWCSKRQYPGQKPLQRCAACKAVVYCSRECQTADWSTHKRMCKITIQLAQKIKASDPEERSAATEFIRWARVHSPVFMITLYHALKLDEKPDAYKSKCLFVHLTAKPNRHNYPLHQRYSVLGGRITDLDYIRRLLGGRFGDETVGLDNVGTGESKEGLVMLACDDVIGHSERVPIYTREEVKSIMRGVEVPYDWVKWLDKAVNENFRAKVNVPKSAKGNQR